jgi:hypothetical protein
MRMCIGKGASGDQHDHIPTGAHPRRGGDRADLSGGGCGGDTAGDAAALRGPSRPADAGDAAARAGGGVLRHPSGRAGAFRRQASARRPRAASGTARWRDPRLRRLFLLRDDVLDDHARLVGHAGRRRSRLGRADLGSGGMGWGDGGGKGVVFSHRLLSL